MIVVSDTSALSCLAELGEMDLFRRLYGTMAITTTVYQEVCHAGAPSALRDFFASPPSWLRILPDVLPYLEETRVLDPGEASTITLAWQYRDSCLVIMDEKRGRSISVALGLRITGVAGILTDASAAGMIDFEMVFHRLSLTRFHLASSLVEVLRQRYLTVASVIETKE